MWCPCLILVLEYCQLYKMCLESFPLLQCFVKVWEGQVLTFECFVELASEAICSWAFFFFGGRFFKITFSVFLLVFCLLRFSISSLYSLGRLSASRIYPFFLVVQLVDIYCSWLSVMILYFCDVICNFSFFWFWVLSPFYLISLGEILFILLIFSINQLLVLLMFSIFLAFISTPIFIFSFFILILGLISYFSTSFRYKFRLRPWLFLCISLYCCEVPS